MRALFPTAACAQPAHVLVSDLEFEIFHKTIQYKHRDYYNLFARRDFMKKQLGLKHVFEKMGASELPHEYASVAPKILNMMV